MALKAGAKRGGNMSDQEYRLSKQIKDDLNKMSAEMKKYKLRGMDLDYRDVQDVTRAVANHAAKKKTQTHPQLPYRQDLNIYQELKEQLMIDDDTRAKLMKRKRVPALVKQADDEKNALRSKANANIIVKVFKGISKKAKADAAKKLAEFDVTKKLLADKRYEDPLQPSQYTDYEDDLTRVSQPRQKTKKPEKKPVKKTEMKGDYDLDLQRAIQASLEDQKKNKGREKNKKEFEPEIDFYDETSQYYEENIDADFEQKQIERAIIENYKANYWADNLYQPVKHTIQQKPPKQARPKEDVIKERATAEKKIAELKSKQKKNSAIFPFMPIDLYEAAMQRNTMTVNGQFLPTLTPADIQYYYFLDECVEAYLIIKKADEELYSQAEAKPREKRKEKHFAKLANVNNLKELYQHQGTNNCYCCAGTALINQFMLHTGEMGAREEFYTQDEMREYVPDYLTKEEYKDLYGNNDNYELEKKEIDEFCGKDEKTGKVKATFGNIYDIGDFFLKDRKDLAVMRSTFSFAMVRKNDNNYRTIQANMYEKFKNTIEDTLKHGQALALRVTNHYVTIIGIDGDKIEILDSQNDNASKSEWKDIRKYIGYDHNVELTWLRKLNGHEDAENLAKEFRNLEYKDGIFKRLNVGAAYDGDIAHKLGVNVSKERHEKEPDVGGYVQESVYVHKKYREIIPEIEQGEMKNDQ